MLSWIRSAWFTTLAIHFDRVLNLLDLFYPVPSRWRHQPAEIFSYSEGSLVDINKAIDHQPLAFDPYPQHISLIGSPLGGSVDYYASMRPITDDLGIMRDSDIAGASAISDLIRHLDSVSRISSLSSFFMTTNPLREDYPGQRDDMFGSNRSPYTLSGFTESHRSFSHKPRTLRERYGCPSILGKHQQQPVWEDEQEGVGAASDQVFIDWMSKVTGGKVGWYELARAKCNFAESHNRLLFWDTPVAETADPILQALEANGIPALTPAMDDLFESILPSTPPPA